MTIDEIAYQLYMDEFNEMKLYEYLTPPSLSGFINGKNYDTSFYKKAKKILRNKKLEALINHDN